MRKTLLSATITALIVSVATPVYAVQGATVEQRVKRLERMLENPVLLQLSRRLGEQQRDIQSLQDENDRLKRDLNKLRALMDKRYTESDERFSALEGGKPTVKPAESTTQIAPNESRQASIVPVVSEVIVDNPDITQAVVEESKPVLEAKNSNLAIVDNSTMVEQTPSTVVESEMVNAGSVTVESPEIKVMEEVVKPEIEVDVEVMPYKTHPATEIEKSEYKAAFTLMRASKYTESIEAFQAFLQTYPKSDLASNAAYWSGEGFLIKERNQEALESFLMVMQRYPDSSKVPDATLRAGDSYERLGNADKAVELFQQIIKSRPHSRAAKNAKKRLEN